MGSNRKTEMAHFKQKNSFKLGDSRIWHSHNIYINLEFVVCICLQFLHFWKHIINTFFYLCSLGGNLSEIWLCHGGWSTRDNVRTLQLFFNFIGEICFCQRAAPYKNDESSDLMRKFIQITKREHGHLTMSFHHNQNLKIEQKKFAEAKVLL